MYLSGFLVKSAVFGFYKLSTLLGSNVDTTIFTTILIDSPINDLKFMFRSKEGIRLPDLEGRLSNELDSASPDFDKINALLWEEDIIWPVGHFSLGLWHNNSISFDQYNRSQPPIDISWLNQK